MDRSSGRPEWENPHSVPGTDDLDAAWAAFLRGSGTGAGYVGPGGAGLGIALNLRPRVIAGHQRDQHGYGLTPEAHLNWQEQGRQAFEDWYLNSANESDMSGPMFDWAGENYPEHGSLEERNYAYMVGGPDSWNPDELDDFAAWKRDGGAENLRNLRTMRDPASPRASSGLLGRQNEDENATYASQFDQPSSDAAPPASGPEGSRSDLAHSEADPFFVEAQRNAVRDLQNISNQGGMTSGDREAARMSGLQELQTMRGARESTMQNMAERGMGGSGAELQSILSGQQANANALSGRGAALNIEAQRRAMEAIQNVGNISQQGRGQSFGEASTRGGASDVQRTMDEQRDIDRENALYGRAADRAGFWENRRRFDQGVARDEDRQNQAEAAAATQAGIAAISSIAGGAAAANRPQPSTGGSQQPLSSSARSGALPSNAGEDVYSGGRRGRPVRRGKY